MDKLLRDIAAAHGIALQYQDVFGKVHEVPDATVRAILAAMHVDATTGRGVGARARGRRRLPPMTVVRSNAKPWRVRARLPQAIADVIQIVEGSMRALVKMSKGRINRSTVGRRRGSYRPPPQCGELFRLADIHFHERRLLGRDAMAEYA